MPDYSEAGGETRGNRRRLKIGVFSIIMVGIVIVCLLLRPQAAGTPSAPRPFTSTCPSGSYQVANSQLDCYPCIPGQYSASGASSCTRCAAGRYQASAGRECCEACAAGSVQSQSGGRFCSSCPAGSYSPSLGATACEKCRTAGTYEYMLAGASECAEAHFSFRGAR